MWERYPPTPPISLRGTRLRHREKPHKLLQVGAIPTPATILRSEPTRSRTKVKDALHSLVRRRALVGLAQSYEWQANPIFQGSDPIACL